MMFSPLKNDRLAGQEETPQQMLGPHWTDEVEDSKWDGFLESTSLGQFQQSSGWARIKTNENWQVHRFVFNQQGQSAGGFQLLSRKTRMGNIGYISKGPILLEDTEGNWRQCMEVLRRLAKSIKLTALLIQPPDFSGVKAQWLSRQGFQIERFMNVIDASLWFDLDGTSESIMNRMPGYNRTFIRQATRKGVTVREGDESNLPEFFDLMIQTCQRQGTTANPATLDAVRGVWKALKKRDAIRLAFADYNGTTLAALISISFGNRMTLWKKGWTSEHGNFRPNHLLYYDALCWGQRSGFKFCDFYSVDRNIAETLLQGAALTKQQAQSRDRFHLGFGGRPVLLPRAFIHIPNSLFRLAYSVAGQKFIRRFSETLRKLASHRKR